MLAVLLTTPKLFCNSGLKKRLVTQGQVYFEERVDWTIFANVYSASFFFIVNLFRSGIEFWLAAP